MPFPFLDCALRPSRLLFVSHFRTLSLLSALPVTFTCSVPPVRRPFRIHALCPSRPLSGFAFTQSVPPVRSITNYLSLSLPCSPTVAFSLSVSPLALPPTNSLSPSLPRSHTVAFSLSFPPLLSHRRIVSLSLSPCSLTDEFSLSDPPSLSHRYILFLLPSHATTITFSLSVPPSLTLPPLFLPHTDPGERAGAVSKLETSRFEWSSSRKPNLKIWLG
ncbi:unnamed protein product [Closterium sp. NIES-65]|nr:unnamed protein product [Closterium sp. NIES-65]